MFSEAQRRGGGWISPFQGGYFLPPTNPPRLTQEVGELAPAGNHPFGQKTQKKDEGAGHLPMGLPGLTLRAVLEELPAQAAHDVVGVGSLVANRVDLIQRDDVEPLLRVRPCPRGVLRQRGARQDDSSQQYQERPHGDLDRRDEPILHPLRVPSSSESAGRP